MKEYQHSEEFRASGRKYRHSSKGRATRWAYRHRPEVVARIALYNAKYRERMRVMKEMTEAQKYAFEYRRRPEVRRRTALYNKRYREAQRALGMPKCSTTSATMKKLWAKRRSGGYIGRIVEKKKYIIKTTIVGSSKQELLRKIRLLKQQVKREIQ